MAELVSGNKLKLNDGSIITPNNGGWYDGRRFLNGQLLAPNEYEPGKQVGAETRAQSAAAQGVSLQTFDSFLNNQNRIEATNLQAPVNISLPSSSATGSNLNGLNADVERARKALEDTLAKQKAENDAKLTKLREQEQSALTEVKTLTTPFRAELEKTEREKLFVDKNFNENQKLVDELDQLLTEGNDLIKQQKEVTGLAAIRNPRIQKTMEDISARAGVIQAVMSARNGQIQQAFTMIDRTAGAISDDRKDQISYYETVLNLINRDIVSIDSKQKDIATEQISILKNELTRSEATVDLVKQYMLDPSKAQLMGQAGVSLNDSVETINSKLAQTAYLNEVRDVNNKMAIEGYTSVYDPSSVPADKLVTITDSRGQKYYYKKTTSGSGFDTSTFFKNIQDMGFKVDNSGQIKTNDQVNVDTIWDEIFNSSISTYAGKPNFEPSGGIGTIWTDSTGNKWIYTSQGWVNNSKNSVKPNMNILLDETKTANQSAQLKN